jgi:hypothetical protein
MKYYNKPSVYATEYEPPPKPATGDLWKEVIADMEARRDMGVAKYGTPLQTFNGRDPLIDAYQEALDLAVYLKQAIMERQEDES